MLRFNNNFKYPLRENFIEGATKYVDSLQYIYKNETLVNFLEIDYNLCEKLELQSIFKIKIRK